MSSRDSGHNQGPPHAVKSIKFRTHCTPRVTTAPQLELIILNRRPTSRISLFDFLPGPHPRIHKDDYTRHVCSIHCPQRVGFSAISVKTDLTRSPAVWFAHTMRILYSHCIWKSTIFWPRQPSDLVHSRSYCFGGHCTILLRFRLGVPFATSLLHVTTKVPSYRVHWFRVLLIHTVSFSPLFLRERFRPVKR
jgi:hypothetical protein